MISIGLSQWLESACNVGDPGSIPGSERSPGEGNGCLLQYSCLEKICGQRSLAGYVPWGHKELDTTEWLTLHLISFLYITSCCLQVEIVLSLPIWVTSLSFFFLPIFFLSCPFLSSSLPPPLLSLLHFFFPNCTGYNFQYKIVQK